MGELGRLPLFEPPLEAGQAPERLDCILVVCEVSIDAAYVSGAKEQYRRTRGSECNLLHRTNFRGVGIRT
jgi:hypothetical protein